MASPRLIFAIRVAQPLCDLTFAIALSWLAIRAGELLQTLFPASAWMLIFVFGAMIPALAILVIKTALYFIPLWSRSKFCDPSWNDQARLFPIIACAMQVALFVWTVVMLFLSGNAQTHPRLGDLAFVLAFSFLMMIGCLATDIIAFSIHKKIGATVVSVDGNGINSKYQKELEALEESSAPDMSLAEISVDGVSTGVIPAMAEDDSDEIIRDRTPLIELEPNAAPEDVDDEGSEELAGSIGTPKAKNILGIFPRRRKKHRKL